MSDAGTMHPVEELFLDISIHEVLTQTMVTFVEPWKTGGVEDGLIVGQGPNPDITVLDQIREDAVEAKTNEPALYAEALELYRMTSSIDGHPEVLKIIFDTDRMVPRD
ncbi:uncharacterized protein FFB14_13546 [Fusarium fujikuroi]|nr:uncharacterized protein FFB14_13546 [Fusarium fujikuroi]